jgi:CheY-like chemotaxis protein
MTLGPDRQPAIVLVDDDLHSARLMLRMLAAHGGPEVKRIADPVAAIETLRGVASVPQRDGPCMVIVDLKSSSGATRDFVAQLSKEVSGLLIVAMSPTLDRTIRGQLIEAGAAAVFERQANIDLYRREAACIIAFWVRNQRLDAVGT